MQLYEDILSDANDYGIQVIFHGCTLPRGWERMFPNYVSSEAVLASEKQRRFDRFANKASLHCKQGFFGVQTRLVCDAKKPCLQRGYAQTAYITVNKRFTIHVPQTILPCSAIPSGDFPPREKTRGSGGIRQKKCAISRLFVRKSVEFC